MWEKSFIPYDFKPQYEDEHVNNGLCNLTDIMDLPWKATLKHLALVTLSNSSATATSDTEGSSANAEILATAGASTLPRWQQWPEFFHIWNLCRCQVQTWTGRSWSISPDIKHNILGKTCWNIEFQGLPWLWDFSSVSKALISKHPCFIEPGLQPGLHGWKNSLEIEISNYCTKLQKAECEAVTINGA